jgi:hypothetical protein
MVMMSPEPVYCRTPGVLIAGTFAMRASPLSGTGRTLLDAALHEPKEFHMAGFSRKIA